MRPQPATPAVRPTRKVLRASLRWASTLAIAAAPGCGSDAEPANDTAAADVVEDTQTGCTLPGSSFVAGPAVANEDLSIAVQYLGGSSTVKGNVLVPASCQKAAPCPLVVLVSGPDESPRPTWTAPAERLAASTGSVVVLFNLPGTGIGGHKSGGENDLGGDLQATATKEVMRLVAERPYVDKARSGYIGIGYGVVPAAAALNKFSQNSLPFVRFLIDVEGPSDRCAASESPSNPALSIGPDDGPGVSESSCNFGGQLSHASAYPPANGDNPASIVCALGAWPITDTGINCSDNTWWAAREPARLLKTKSVKVHYQRLQFRHDHKLPSYHASRVMMTAIAGSGSTWFALNDMPPCTPPLTDEVCAGLLEQCQRCWLEGTWGTGFGAAPYAGADRVEIDTIELLGDVLPRFVRRLTDLEASKKCR